MIKKIYRCFEMLKNNLQEYEIRPQQKKMAYKIIDCFANEENLMVEAGTGVGKSFAYLIPAIVSKKKTVVSTASIALQNQLITKDLVFLKKNLPYAFSFALLKGKSNYICIKRENEFAPELGDSYKVFNDWLSNTRTGDKDELHIVPDFWNKVCCDSDDCNVSLCPSFKECFYYRHYKKLFRYDILVVNHHILVHDILSEFKLLPFHNQVIIDEAHHLENVISDVFGNKLYYSRLVWLLFRIKSCKIPVDHLYAALDSFFKQKNDSLQPISPIPEDVIEKLALMKEKLNLDKLYAKLRDLNKDTEPGDDVKDRLETTIGYIKSIIIDIEDFIDQKNNEKVYYTEKNKNYLELRSNLIEAHTAFDCLINAYKSIIMTSATLTAGEDFNFLKTRLGVEGFKEMILDSPFDYKKQGLLYLEKNLPQPNKKNMASFQQQGLGIIEQLINASQGRALVLFTSYSHLRFVKKNIRTVYPFKSQGDMPAPKLIEWFRKTSNSVLFATATFWQGIDIKGDDLSLVIISKIPFISPGNPVYDERCNRLQDRWFADLALPSAILLLKQGVGRLIRGGKDSGVVAILDTRLMKTYYGKKVISSLPDMGIVHDVDSVRKFFSSTGCYKINSMRKN